MCQLKKLQSWLVAYKKANDCDPEIPLIKEKIKMLLKEGSVTANSKSSKIYFRDSKWNNYDILRKYLSEDKKFVEEYAGVDLRAYIESALRWSEKGNLTTDTGWLLNLRAFMRSAKQEGKLIMKPVYANKEVFRNQ